MAMAPMRRRSLADQPKWLQNAAMTTSDYVPWTPLEALVRDAMAGIGSERYVLAMLTKSRVCIPSTTDVQSQGDAMTPLIVQSQRFDGPMVVIFDDARHIGPQVSARARYWLDADGAWLIKSTAPGHGLMLFVGPNMGCELSAELLDETRGALADQ
jgi:hypothetical protein